MIMEMCNSMWIIILYYTRVIFSNHKETEFIKNYKIKKRGLDDNQLTEKIKGNSAS